MMYNKTNWPVDQHPKVSATYALNDIDIKAPAEVVWKLLADAENWVSYFPPEDQVKILSGESELALGTTWSRVTVGFLMHLTVIISKLGREAKAVTALAFMNAI